ncbi:hypothetical protein [Legionella fairfieldensis]|uniref:hypothetical protein n=1 Tax=Legionella fairfieldensis TaxID=45064 RepID=UPI00048CA367|nr:hypothetical protein [Legionella fairfieldensis]
MKIMIIKLATFFLIIVSLTAFADQFLIRQKPVPLIAEQNYYSFPADYVPIDRYHYVYVGGENRVCFLEQRPELSSLDLLRISIMQNDKKFRWFCYRYDPRFFVIDF